MPHSYEVNGPRYLGVQAFKPEVVSDISKDIVKPGEPAKSMMHIPVSYSSYPYGESSPTIIGDFAFMKSGGGRLEAFHVSDMQKYGLPTHWEERGDRFEAFKFAGEGVMPNMFDIIPKNPNVGYVEGITPLGLYLPHYSDTQMRDIRTTPRLLSADDPNREGYNISRTQNFKQVIRDTIWDEKQAYREEFVDWISFLAEKGFTVDKAQSPGILGLGTRNIEAIAAYMPMRGYLVRGNQFSDLNEIEAYDPEYGAALKRYGIHHEIAHHLGIFTRNDRKDEKLQGLLAEEFYARRAKKYEGTRMERVYKLLSEDGRAYAKAFSFWSNLLRGQSSNDLFDSEPARQYIKKFQKEAEKYGLSGKKAQAYVNRRMKDVFRVFFDSESSQEENLDGLVQDAYESLPSAAENGNSTRNYQTTIDGKVIFMPNRNSKSTKKEGKKGRVLDGKDKFGKSRYDGRTAEADAKYSKAEPDAISDGDAEASPESSGEAKGDSAKSGEAGQGEPTAEAA